MKKIRLNLLIAGVIVMVCGAFFSSCSDKDEEITYLISLNELPMDAQTFLNDFFPSEKARTVEKQSIGKVIMYNVELDNGYDMLFNEDGLWQEVSAPENKTLPSGIAPEAIEEYVAKNYPDYGINEINRTGDGYNVEIIGGVRLTFNSLGECTGTFPDL